MGQRLGCVPFGQLDCYPARPPQEGELSGVEVEYPGAGTKAGFLHALDHLGNVTHREAYVVEPDLVEVADVRIWDRGWMNEFQQLDLGPRSDVLRHEGDVLSFDFRKAHVLGERLALDDNRDV